MENQKELKEILAENSRSRIREGNKRDQLLVTMTAGTLVISVTFLVNIVTKVDIIQIQKIFVSWSFLVISLILSLLGLMFADFYFLKKEKDIIKKIKNEPEIDSVNLQYDTRNKWWDIIYIIDYVSIFFSILGIVFFAWFGFVNIKHFAEVKKADTAVPHTSHFEIPEIELYHIKSPGGKH